MLMAFCLKGISAIGGKAATQQLIMEVQQPSLHPSSSPWLKAAAKKAPPALAGAAVWEGAW